MMQPEAEMFDRLRKVEMAQGTHEAVCAERYAGIRSDINSITKILKQVGIGLLGGMALILAKLVFH